MKFAALLLLACAPTSPYVTERLLYPRAWDWPAHADENVAKEIRCHNTTPRAAWFDIYCDGEKHPDARLWILAKDSAAYFGEVSARYTVGEACVCGVAK